MDKEFCLSDYEWNEWAIERLQKAVRLLKEEFKDNFEKHRIYNKIDKLFGDKLI